MSDDQVQLPDLETLFGQSSFCQCEDCGSIYSPAAYFVDVLYSIVEKGISAVDQNGKRTAGTEILFNRRPDLENIELTCQNTNTPLPYIDLTNEILENAVVPDGNFPQTTGTLEELAANPEHVKDGAYDKVKQAVYPPTLPFNLALEEARTYLEHLGSSRVDVMRTFQKGGDSSDYKKGAPSGLAIACEYLGISPEEHGILTGTDLAGLALAQTVKLPEFYGYPKQQQTDFIKTWQKVSVTEFLQRTGVNYLDLIELLKTRFLNPNQTITLEPPADTDPCDLSKVTIKGLDEGVLNKTHRFIRLSRKLGWQIADLDKAIKALGASDIDDPFIVKLAEVVQVQANLNLPLPQLFSLWANIETIGDDSLYDQLFQNKAVLKPVDLAFKLNQDRSELDAPGILSNHLASILAALGISATDLVAIRTSTGLAGDQADLNLANLSKLYQHAVLAKALNVSVNDFLALRVLTGVDPFQVGDPSSTVKFLTKVQKIRQSGFSISILNYIYRHLYDPTSGIAPLETDLNLLVTSLQAGLKKIIDDTTVAPDPTGGLLRQKLAVILKSSLIDPAMNLIGGTSAYSTPLASLPDLTFPDELKNKISYDSNSKQLRFAGSMTDAQKAKLLALSADQNYATAVNDLSQQARKDLKSFIATNLSAFLDSSDVAVAQLINNNSADRLDFVLTRLMAYLRNSLSGSLIKQTLSDNLKLDSQLTRLLLEGVADPPSPALLKSRTDPLQPAIADFLALGTPPTPDLLIKAAKSSYQRLHKVALLVNTFRMTVKEVAYLSAHGSDFAGVNPANILEKAPFDLNQLPLDPSGFKPSLFSQFERLVDLFTLRDTLPRGETGLVDLFQAASTSQDPTKLSPSLVDQVTATTRWNGTELSKLTAGFNFVDADFKNELGLVRLQACCILINRLGVSADPLFAWAATGPNTNQSQDIKNAVKAKYDDRQWLTVAKPLQDVFRERKRLALVSFLVGNPIVNNQKFSTSNDLFDYFLIDVEMSACQMTSRIKQAISSVQLFVQRCLMNLETYPYKGDNAPKLTIAPECVQWWQWMNSYRTWEPNRRIWATPENWVDFGSLPDPSPMFSTLKSRLMQGEITADSAEDAFREYLEKLDQVARLEVVGLYHEKPPTPGDSDVLHVFARTWSIPHVYFYRRRVSVDDSAYWTAWEKVDADIEGDHLIPVVWNRRLHIFWPISTEKAVEGGLTIKLDKELPPPEKYWEIQLAWSEYKKGKWTAKSLSSGPALATWSTGNSYSLNKSDFIFKTDVDQKNDLVVHCVFEEPESKSAHDPRWWFEGSFLSTCNGAVMAKKLESNTPSDFLTRAAPLLPYGSTTESMMIVEHDPNHALSLPTNADPQDTQEEMVLTKSPYLFRLVYPQDQIDSFFSRDPFFYQDDQRTFFVEPHYEPPVWSVPEEVQPDFLLQQPVYQLAESDQVFYLQS